jgi:hypothetical protein
MFLGIFRSSVLTDDFICCVVCEQYVSFYLLQTTVLYLRNLQRVSAESSRHRQELITADNKLVSSHRMVIIYILQFVFFAIYIDLKIMCHKTICA